MSGVTSLGVRIHAAKGYADRLLFFARHLV
jgi:hypothetical protein